MSYVMCVVACGVMSLDVVWTVSNEGVLSVVWCVCVCVCDVAFHVNGVMWCVVVCMCLV